MPRCRPRSLRETIIVVKEILAPCRRGAFARLGRGGSDDGLQDLLPRLPVGHGGDRDEPHCRLAMSGKNDLLAGLRATDKIGQLAFGGRYGDLHLKRTISWSICA